MPKKEKQVEAKSSHEYSVKEMGILISEKTIFLHSSFIREKLNVGSRLDALSEFKKKDTTTQIGCPFCKKGFLKLDKVEPDYSGGRQSVPMKMYHVGNKYEYNCSNPDCGGRFFGTYTWMYID